MHSIKVCLKIVMCKIAVSNHQNLSLPNRLTQCGKGRIYHREDFKITTTFKVFPWWDQKCLKWLIKWRENWKHVGNYPIRPASTRLEAFLGMNILHSFSNRLDAKKLQMCWNFSDRSNPCPETLSKVGVWTNKSLTGYVLWSFLASNL